jgi:hypothetical protein
VAGDDSGDRRGSRYRASFDRAAHGANRRIVRGVLLIGFASYALYYVYALHGEPLECGCFGGIIASQLGVKTALRNLAAGTRRCGLVWISSTRKEL